MSQPAAAETTSPATAFDRIGGREPIARLVNRFYDLMDIDPAFAELRAMHADDLTPVRESLAEFLMAWMGGPRDWFEKRPGACVMSAHANLPGMNEAVGEQWIAAMDRAARETIPEDPEFAAAMVGALSDMARAMSRPRPKSV